MENFDMIAKRYDTEERVKRAEKIADAIRGHITGGGKSAIEYGCGTGLVGLRLAGDFKSLLLVDSSPKMIEQAKAKISAEQAASVSALCADFADAPPEGLHADYIFSSLAFHHIRDTANILRRIYGILNPGGRLLIVDIDMEDGSFHADHPGFDGHNGFDRAGLAKLALEAGFASAGSEIFLHGVKRTGDAQWKEAAYSLFIFDAER